MAAHHLVKCHGLRSNVGYMKTEDADIAMIYMDEKGLELHQLELIEGTLPQAKNEIVVTKGILSELSQNGEVGDTITVPYQVERNGWLDYAQEKEFVISGFLADTELGLKEKAFTTFVSEDFLKKEVPEEQVAYRFILQVQTDTFTTTEEIEADIAFLAGQFGIKEQSVKVNKDSLWVNYIDPAYVPGIIVLAGVITIYSIYYVSMAVTGLFFMVIATIISCADPEETSRNNFRAQYEMAPKIKFGDKEHPELEWKQVMKENPMTEELKQKILRIQGISSVEVYEKTYVTSDAFQGDREWIVGIPETGKKELEEGMIEGSVTYEELMSGDKVVVDEQLFYWYPNLKPGDILEVTVEDGDETHTRKLEVAAIGDYPLSFRGFSFLIMAGEGIRTFSSHNLNYNYHIYADEPYSEEVEVQLNEILDESDRILMDTWKEAYELDKSNITMVSGVCYIFLGVLGIICIMNMINMMINSVHVRKKEIGILQAVGMSNGQLRKMLRIEGMFYTIGTLIIAVGGVSLAGYPVYLWARENGLLSISEYHYPLLPAIIVVIVLTAVQMILTLVLGKSVKKESLIDRIRFSN